jgi:hypothetical protein
VQLTCNIDRQDAVMSGQQRTVDHRGGLSTDLTFRLVIALWHYSGVVVRDRIELSTFRFSGGRSYRLSYLTWLGSQ